MLLSLIAGLECVELLDDNSKENVGLSVFFLGLKQPQ